MKRARVSDLKFFGTKAQLSVGGSKMQITQRLLEWKVPAIKRLTVETTRTDNNPLATHAAGVWLRLLRTEGIIEPLARLFHVQLRSSVEAPAAIANNATQETTSIPSNATTAANALMPEGILTSSRERQDVDLVYISIDKDTGQIQVEVFLDLLDIDRHSQHPLRGCFSARSQALRNSQPYDVCPNGVHEAGCCKCHLPVIFVGQDESIYK